MAVSASLSLGDDSIKKPHMAVPGSSLGDTPLVVILSIDDPDVVTELLKREGGHARNVFAVSALRIGVLALRQALGNVDAEIVRNEGHRLISNLGHELPARTRSTIRLLSNSAMAEMMVTIALPSGPSVSMASRIDRNWIPSWLSSSSTWRKCFVARPDQDNIKPATVRVTEQLVQRGPPGLRAADAVIDIFLDYLATALTSEFPKFDALGFRVLINGRNSQV